MPTLNLFLGMATQWRIAPMGGLTGLDYSAITPLVLRGLRIALRDWPAIFDGLRVMEDAALEALSEVSDRSSRARSE